MELLNTKTTLELLSSLIGEVAKSSNEIRCAQQDINKIQSRLNFSLVLINEIKDRVPGGNEIDPLKVWVGPSKLL